MQPVLVWSGAGIAADDEAARRTDGPTAAHAGARRLRIGLEPVGVHAVLHGRDGAPRQSHDRWPGLRAERIQARRPHDCRAWYRRYAAPVQPASFWPAARSGGPATR
ncbi:hypothetical protein G6F54_013903 [Rhizopus delemar]|nr:hypothetical protein G6F54_013903 [Rhizopus delemar]